MNRSFLHPILCIVCFHVSVASEQAKVQTDQRTGNPLVEVELTDRDPVTFRITNHSKRAVTLDSLFGSDSEYPYAPAYERYEYLSHKRWVTLPTCGAMDVFVYPYILSPGKSVVFQDYFDEKLKRLRRGTPVRYRVGDFVSKPFRW